MTRNTSVSMPAAKPIVATNRPMVTKESARPTASATGPSRCSLAAVPSTMGRSGKTQGDNTDNTPARNASPSVAIMRRLRSSRARYSALFTSAAILSGSVTPTDRPVSVSPLKAISVLCEVACMARTSAF